MFLNAGTPEWPHPSFGLISAEEHLGSVIMSAGNQSMLDIVGSAGSVRVNADEDHGPSLTLMDHEGYSLNLGRSDLEFPCTGRKERTPAASVVLFGKDNKVLWSAP